MLQLRKSYDIGVVVSVRDIHIRRGLIDENLGRSYSRGMEETKWNVYTIVLRICIVYVACLHRVKRL